MSIPTTSWDEASPAGSDNIALGDNRIRELKTQIREVINVDHDFPSSGQAADVGQHKQVTLQEQADLGTGAVGATILGSQTVGGKGELMYTDEDDNDVQLTSAGKIYLGGVTLASMATLMGFIYPVGSVVTLGVSTNPATLFGVGTWTAIAGKVIVGIDAGQTEFDTLNETGGAKTHTITAEQIPITISTGGITDGPGDIDFPVVQSATAFSIMNPHIVKYVWERTA
jgi:hypothetical protein